MKYKKRFYDQYVSSHTDQIYGEVSIESVKANFLFNEAYFGKFLPPQKDALILDVGCGNGGFVLWLQSKGFHLAEGVDISSEQIDQGIEIGVKNIQVADFMEFLKNNENRYDVIFARDVLEHLDKEEVLEFLDLVKRSLKSGGGFVSQTVNAENILWGRLRYADFTHDQAFTSIGIRQLLLVMGFRNINIYPQRPVIHGIVSFLRWVLWGFVELILNIYLLIETGSRGDIFTQNIITKAEK